MRMVYLHLIAVRFILRISLVIFTAGNGYAFLSAFLKFGEPHRLQQALVFAEAILCQSPGDCCSEADSPFSLFEGLCGTVHFLLDVLQVQTIHSDIF